MSIGRERLGRLLSNLVADSASTREEAAETVSDWADSHDTYSDFEARILVRSLALVAAFEESVVAREAELNALSDLFSPTSMAVDDVAPALNIPERNLGPSEREYIKGLHDLLDG
jgi:hypothetical protein